MYPPDPSGANTSADPFPAPPTTSGLPTCGAWFTSTPTGRELLPANAASPPYAAVTVWWPTDRVVVETLTGPDPATALPTAAPSTENVTVPVGVPGAPGVGKIWAVNVTDVPGVDAAGLADSETDVGTCCTTWVSDPEAGLNPLVGLYCIVIWCVPTGSVETVRVACCWPPEAVSGTVARGVVPSRKLTAPVGAGLLAGTVTTAENVTDWPGNDGVPLVATLIDVPSGLTVCVTVGEADAANAAVPR